MIHQFNADVGKNNFVTVVPFKPQEIVTCIRESISRTVSRAKHTGLTAGLSKIHFGPLVTYTKKGYSLHNDIPNWTSVTPQKATLYANKPIQSFEALQRRNLQGFGYCNSQDSAVKIANQPFSEGESRIAYRGQVFFSGQWHDYVFKEFKVNGEGIHALR
eukprot:Awhi_evm2s4060